MVFCSVRNDVLTQVVVKITPCRQVKGYGHFGGTLALKVKGETSQMIWIFTNTAVRISPPPAVVPKRSHETTNRCVKSQTSANLINTAFVARDHATVEVLRFLLSAGCFVVLFTCMLVIFRYTKTIRQQVKGKTKWAEIHHLLKLFVMW